VYTATSSTQLLIALIIIVMIVSFPLQCNGIHPFAVIVTILSLICIAIGVALLSAIRCVVSYYTIRFKWDFCLSVLFLQNLFLGTIYIHGNPVFGLYKQILADHDGIKHHHTIIHQKVSGVDLLNALHFYLQAFCMSIFL
jgi:hypothetical protein